MIEMPKTPITPTTKRIIVAGLSMICIVAGAGWAMGNIRTNDAMLVISPIITGFFALVRD